MRELAAVELDLVGGGGTFSNTLVGRSEVLPRAVQSVAPCSARGRAGCSGLPQVQSA